MNRKQRRSKLYLSFCKADGNLHIASEYAIEKIDNLISKFKIKAVLEVGLGIGSISGVLLALNRNNSDLFYAGTEANEFCLKALPENLAKDYGRMEIYSNLTNIPSDKRFDLIILDGNDQHLKSLKDLVSERGILVIEGDRMQQQNLLQELFPDHKYVHSISKAKNKIYSPFSSSHWQGGLKIIFINPTVFQKLWYVREKIYTKLKYMLLR
jgi:hypothetical protein